MTHRKLVSLLTLGVVGIGAISAGIGAPAVSALSSREKAEKLADLTGKPVEEIVEEKYSKGKTYGEIAEENGVLDQFQTQNANCDGTGNGAEFHNGEHNSSSAHNYRHDSGHGHGHGHGHGGNRR